MKEKVQKVATVVAPQSPPAISNQGNPQNKNRYSDEELRYFKKILLDRIEEFQSDQKNFEDQMKRSTNRASRDSTGVYAEGAAASEIAICALMISQKADLLHKLHAALGRINNKTFGICRVTGRLIPKERLQRAPHATLCVEAKLARDSR